MPIELSIWSIHTYTHRAMIIITLTVGNDEVRSKPQVENIISHSLCTGRLDFFEKLEVFIQVIDSQPAHKPPKMQLTKYKQSGYIVILATIMIFILYTSSGPPSMYLRVMY